MLSLATVGLGLVAAVPAIIPQPVSMKPGVGSFGFATKPAIVARGSAVAVARILQGYWKPLVGEIKGSSSGNGSTISISIDKKLTDVGAEGYRLEVTPTKIELKAATPAGAFYGVQTLRQLLPLPDYSRVADIQLPTVPSVSIQDQPRFGWRGNMIDIARHFMPKEWILKHIDSLAFHKLNVLHIHLTDDQGWRIEIKRYPKLTALGSTRDFSMSGHYEEQKFDGKPHGGFLTQKDIKEIVAYAAARYITVVPEIEMPGHAQAALAAYPELGEVQNVKVGTQWGVFENVFNTKDSTVEFLQNVLTEVTQLFPSKFIHVGGDEVPKTQWKKSAGEQERIKARGLKNEEELQSWFIRQMDGFLAKKGRRLLGWDEILEGGLAPGATVMSWRGIGGGITAAKSGHDVVMAPTSHTYFDYYQAQPADKEPLGIGGFVPIEKVYSFDPMPSELSPEQGKHVLGLQAQLWSEYITTTSHMEYMAFPRLCALAEVGWTPQASRNWPSFRERLALHVSRLGSLGINFRKLD